MKKNWYLLLIIAAVTALDRITKSWVVAALAGKIVTVCPWLSFCYVKNTGAAFGMLYGNNLFFIMLTAVLIFLLLFYRKAFGRGILVNISLSLIVTGAVNNFFDRLAYGHVVDFISFSFFPPVFNIADSAITAGACVLALTMLLKDRSNIKNRRNKTGGNV